MLRVKFLPSTDTSLAAALWQKLESEVGDGQIACSWLWTNTWLKHYGGRIPHFFAVGEENGVCAVALLTRQTVWRGPFRINAIHVGTAGEPEAESVCVEHNGVLAAPDAKRAFAKALLVELAKDPSWDEICLDGFSQDEAAPFTQADLSFQVELRPTFVFDFGKINKGEDVLNSLDKKVRKKISFSIKKIGTVTSQWAETSEEAGRILSELKDLHQKRWTSIGKPGAFSNPRFQSFHQDLVQQLHPHEAVLLFRASASFGTLGCLYCFIENGNVRFYQSGMARLEDNKITPGFVAILKCMEECRKRGLSEFDFLEGGGYKRLLSNMERNLVWASLRRPRLKFKLINVLKKVEGLITPNSGEELA